MILRTLLKTGKYSPSTEDKPTKYMDSQIQKNNLSKDNTENNIKKKKEYDKNKTEQLYKEWLEKNCQKSQLFVQPRKRMDTEISSKEVKNEPLDIASTRDSEIDEQIDKQMAIFEKNKDTYSGTSNTIPQLLPFEPRKDGYEENAGYLGLPITYDRSEHVRYTQYDGGHAIDRWNMYDRRNSRNYVPRNASAIQSFEECNNDNQAYYSNELSYRFTRTPLFVPHNYPPRSATYLTDKLPELLPLEDYEDEEENEEEAYYGLDQFTFNQIPDGEGLAEDVLKDFSIATHRKVRGPKNWEFLMRLLADPRANPNLIKWEDQENYTFRLVQPEIIIHIWNSKSKRPPISYNNFARGLRYHYKRGALKLVKEHQMVYGCGPEAVNFLKKMTSFQAISHSSSSFFRPWK